MNLSDIDSLMEVMMNIREMILAALFAALTCVGAFITIPITVVPFTLQVLFSLIAGALLGKKVGAISQIVYVLLGVIGLPVFAGGKAGIGIIAGPTGGFIIGFIVGAFVIGWIIELFEKKAKTVIAKIILYTGSMFVGLVVIYVFGVLKLTMEFGFELALTYGFYPYFLPDLLKLAVAVGIVSSLKKPLVKAGYLTV